MPHNKTRLYKKYPRTIGIGALVALAAAGFVVFGNNNDDSQEVQNPLVTTTNLPNSANPETPVKTKNDINGPTRTTNKSSGNVKTVTPVITSVSQEGSNVVVRGYVGDVFEDGGSCTATFHKSGQVVSDSSIGLKNVSYTTCRPIKVDRGKFITDGDWQVTLHYKSAGAEGVSSQQTIGIK